MNSNDLTILNLYLFKEGIFVGTAIWVITLVAIAYIIFGIKLLKETTQ